MAEEPGLLVYWLLPAVLVGGTRSEQQVKTLLSFFAKFYLIGSHLVVVNHGPFIDGVVKHFIHVHGIIFINPKK